MTLSGLELSMPGEHQMRNAAIAVRAAALLMEGGVRLSEQAIRSGLLAACCPLRVEMVSRDPLLIVDAAHNPASIEALCQTLRGVSARRRTAIFASSRDKETAKLLALLNSHFDEILLTTYLNNPRAVELATLQAMARECLTVPWRTVESPSEALATARRESQPKDLICITGSFFLAAEIEELLMPMMSR
jgi:dihydrofolate synthase/folylpolyglutamate synthase